MSQELDTSIALMRRRSRGRSNCCCDGVGGATIAARRVRSRFPTDRHHQSEGFDMLFGTCSCLPTAISMSRRGWFGLVQCREPVNQLEAMGPMPWDGFEVSQASRRATAVISTRFYGHFSVRTFPHPALGQDVTPSPGVLLPFEGVVRVGSGREPVNQLEAMGPMPAGEWLRDVVRVGSLDEPGEPPRGDRAALASQRADREAVPMPSFSELMMPTTPWRVRGAL
jgi:hypothetical protein